MASRSARQASSLSCTRSSARIRTRAAIAKADRSGETCRCTLRLGTDTAAQPVLPVTGPVPNRYFANNELSPPLAPSCACMTQQVRKKSPNPMWSPGGRRVDPCLGTESKRSGGRRPRITIGASPMMNDDEYCSSLPISRRPTPPATSGSCLYGGSSCYVASLAFLHAFSRPLQSLSRPMVPMNLGR